MERVRCVSTLWGIIYAIIRRSLESNNIYGHAWAVRVVYPIKQGRALLKVLGLGLKVIGEDEFALSSFGKVIAGGVRKVGKGSDRGGNLVCLPLAGWAHKAAALFGQNCPTRDRR